MTTKPKRGPSGRHLREQLLDARTFPAIAKTSGIVETERTLILTGRLTPVTICRRTYYRWPEVLGLMPEWARRRHVELGRGTAR